MLKFGNCDKISVFMCQIKWKCDNPKRYLLSFRRRKLPKLQWMAGPYFRSVAGACKGSFVSC